jgi:redox-sensitive bicupin YhaK (pirin superfamily)
VIKIEGREHDLGGGMIVRRLLPFVKKRMVGPFAFLDHMGPFEAQPDQNTDVRPHPHIGLSTLTYLFAGRMVHRDSLGTEAVIHPGEVNWMTAGKGIAHSERTHPEDRHIPHSLHGLQFWVALPDDQEDCEPHFQHYSADVIPQRSTGGLKLAVIAGSGFGMQSPVKITSPLIFAEGQTLAASTLALEFPTFECAIYVIRGRVSSALDSVSTREMMVMDVGAKTELQIEAGSHFVVIGGEPFATPRHVWWNLVSSSKEKIEAAKALWKSGQFPKVPGETEFIPLPPDPTEPLDKKTPAPK